MGIIAKWFGLEGKLGLSAIEQRDASVVDPEMRQVVEDIKQELNDIDAVLEDIDAEGAQRKELLEKVMIDKGRRIQGGLRLAQMIESILDPYVRGERDTKDVTAVLILQALLRDFREDGLWQELLALWKQEYSLIQAGKDVKDNLAKQRLIARQLKAITELTFNETHMHFSLSASPDLHWYFLKKEWPRIRELVAAKAGKGISAGDARKLTALMDGFMAGTISEVKAFVEFEKLIIMTEPGCFHSFHDKANILNVIAEACMKKESPEDFHKNSYDLFYATLDSVARHNLSHTVDYLEIRFPATTNGGLTLVATVAKDVERRYNGRITIRFIEFVMHEEDPDMFIKAYNDAPPWVREYFVGVDLLSPKTTAEHKERIGKMGLPVAQHAGEILSTEDYNGPPATDALKRLRMAESELGKVAGVLACPTIKRIGHANVLGIDLKEYLAGAPQESVKRLLAQQERLLNEVKRKRVVIEVNPTSNVKIAGVTYDEHPLKVFGERGIPFAISTDDRTTFDTTLKKEFFRIAHAMGWKEREIEAARKMQRDAILAK